MGAITTAAMGAACSSESATGTPGIGDPDGGAEARSDGGGSSSVDGASSETERTFASPYFPLEIGLTWTWSPCEAGGESLTAKVTEKKAEEALGGEPAFTVTNPPGCYFATLRYGADENGDVFVNSGAWYRHLELPPRVGESWGAGGASGASFKWEEHYDSFTVPAGTFEDCFKRSHGVAYEIFCKNVGMVKWMTSEAGDGGELLAKNF